MSVSLPFGDAAGMQSYVDSVSNPRSQNFRNWLTPAQIGERFGLQQAQVDTVVGYLRESGFKVNLVGDNRLSVLVEGTVAQAEAAFGTTINRYWKGGQFTDDNVFFANSTTLHVPTYLAGLIQNVSGLESATRPHARALTASQTKSLYSLANAYTGGNKGAGRAVAISNWDGYRLTNVPLYYTQMGLPAPAGGVGSNVHVVTISGGAGAGTAQGEGDLDIQMVLGMAPLCDLYIYDGGSNDLIGVLTKEANDNIVDIASESWGWGLSAAGATAAHNLHLSMSAQGITYMAASGDSGTTIEPYSYPNYDTEVLMVGGTVATVNGTGTRTAEVGWSGSGGGWSTNTATFNKLPSYQHGTGVPTNINYRLSPDVSLHASGSGTGAYQFYMNGSLSSGYVGTSFACPVFAGGLATSEAQIIALGGLPANGAGKRRFGRIQDLIYAQNGRSDVWFDVTSGANGNLPNGTASTAKAGWDFVTGWGAINFDAFVNTQATSSATIPAAPSSLTPTPGNAQVSLTWSASSGATSYNVKRGSAAAGPFTTVGTSTTASFTNTSLTNGTTYYYVVTAVNSAGESGNSPVANATPTGAMQMIINGGFENGGTNWGYTAGVINSNVASQPAHGGTKDAWLGGHAKAVSDNLYQVLTLPTTMTSATLNFYLHIDSAETSASALDTCQVQIRDANNKVLATLATYSNANKAAGYSLKSFSLLAYKGKKIMIYVISQENASKQTSFVFDDFTLNVS